jgi:anti-sigma factor RsiW
MNCASVKSWMRERFDQSLPLEDGFETHLESCDTCRAYVERLRALDAGLTQLTVEAPSPHFDAALAARLRRERNAPSRTWAAGLAVVVACAFVAVGWQLPIESYLREWFVILAAWPPDISVSKSLLTPFVEWGREAWATVELPEFLASVGSPWVSGSSIAMLSVVLVGFNVLFRRFGGDPGSSPFHRTR